MPATLTLKALCEQEGVASASHEVACKKCRKFLMEIAVDSKAVMRVHCLKCGADNFLGIEPDRVTVFQAFAPA